MLRRITAHFIFLAWCLSCATGQVGQRGGASGGADQINSYLAARDYARALELIRPRLEQSPRDTRLWTLEGIALSGLGHDHEALTAYQRALSISPDYLAALEGAAELEYKVGSDGAIPLLKHILRLRPESTTSHAMLGVLAYKQHDCPTVVKHLHEGLEIISSQPVALTQYGSCLMDLQRPDDAVPIFQRILALAPNAAGARYNLAVVQLAAHLAKDAIATLGPLIETSNPDPDVLDLASSAYEESGDTPRAVSLLRQAIVTNKKKATYYLDLAAISFKHSSFQVGIDMMDVGIRNLPEAASLYVARGVLYIQLAQFEKGEADFATANRLDPGQSSGAVAAGLAQIQQSNLDEALATIRSQVKNHPDDAFLHYLQAEVLSQNGAGPGSAEFKEAITAASRAIHLDSHLIFARDLLGNLYLKSGQIDQSIEQSRIALRESPSDQQALYHLIQALRQRGKSSQTELGALVKRLADLREQSRKSEASENKYKLYESKSSGAKDTTSR